jgi:hypothetical protein
MCSRGSRRGSTRIAAPSKRNSANAKRPSKVRAISKISNQRHVCSENIFLPMFFACVFSPPGKYDFLLSNCFSHCNRTLSAQSTFARAAAASPRSPPRAATLFPLRPRRRPRPRPPRRSIIISSSRRRRCPPSGCQCCRRTTPSTAAGARPRNSGIVSNRQRCGQSKSFIVKTKDKIKFLEEYLLFFLPVFKTNKICGNVFSHHKLSCLSVLCDHTHTHTHTRTHAGAHQCRARARPTAARGRRSRRRTHGAGDRRNVSARTHAGACARESVRSL